MGFQQSFKALSDPIRRDILALLRAGPMAAGEIASHFDVSATRGWCWTISRASTFIMS